MIDKEITNHVNDLIDQREFKNAFGVSLIPVHSHNGTDSVPVSYLSLVDNKINNSYTIQGLTAATATNYSTFFISPYKLTFVQAQEVHTTAGTSGSAVTLNIEKLTGTQSPGGGVLMLSTAFNLKGTPNTIQTGVLTSTVTNLGINVGDRLAFYLSGTPTTVANVTVLITLGF